MKICFLRSAKISRKIYAKWLTAYPFANRLKLFTCFYISYSSYQRLYFILRLDRWLWNLLLCFCCRKGLQLYSRLVLIFIIGKSRNWRRRWRGWTFFKVCCLFWIWRSVVDRCRWVCSVLFCFWRVGSRTLCRSWHSSLRNSYLENNIIMNQTMKIVGSSLGPDRENCYCCFFSDSREKIYHRLCFFDRKRGTWCEMKRTFRLEIFRCRLGSSLLLLCFGKGGPTFWVICSSFWLWERDFCFCFIELVCWFFLLEIAWKGTLFFCRHYYNEMTLCLVTLIQTVSFRCFWLSVIVMSLLRLLVSWWGCTLFV